MGRERGEGGRERGGRERERRERGRGEREDTELSTLHKAIAPPSPMHKRCESCGKKLAP
jgi:hypothetical protein